MYGDTFDTDSGQRILAWVKRRRPEETNMNGVVPVGNPLVFLEWSRLKNTIDINRVDLEAKNTCDAKAPTCASEPYGFNRLWDGLQDVLSEGSRFRRWSAFDTDSYNDGKPQSKHP